MKTTIILILDESSSMASKCSEVIKGFNQLIDEQKTIKTDTCRLFMIKFNSFVTTLHRGIPVEEVPELTEETYKPIGCTALYDAISDGVVWADADTADRYLFVIIANGPDGWSKRTSYRKVCDLIHSHEVLGNWTFVYIGDHPDSWSMGTGMSRDNTTQYQHETPGVNFFVLSRAIAEFRKSDELHSEKLLHRTEPSN